jgi:hypothetical protein
MDNKRVTQRQKVIKAGTVSFDGSVTFNFDQRGVLTGTTSSQSGMATGTNLAAGTNAASRPYETVR